MVRCPICKPAVREYKYKGWFARHMTKEHNWQYKEAIRFFEEDGDVCPECGKRKINWLYCNNCGIMFHDFKQEGKKSKHI